MKLKSKLFTFALIGCALVLAFTACAGCTGTDSIVGTYVNSDSSGNKIIFDFHDDGTFTAVSQYSDGIVTSITDNGSWKKTGDKRYESGLIIFQQIDDYTLKITLSNGKTFECTKYSNYKIPDVTPKDSATYKEHQMVGTWKLSTDSGIVTLTLNADNTASSTIYTGDKAPSKITGIWKFMETKNGIYDSYVFISGDEVGAIVHVEGEDTCAFAFSSASAITLTRV